MVSGAQATRRFFWLRDREFVLFPIGVGRDWTFAAGISMGGYGALRLGLSHPDRYAAVASISGVTDILARRNAGSTVQGRSATMDAILGAALAQPDTNADLFTLASALASSEQRPKIYQCCGTEDFLYEENVKFRDHAKELGLDLTYDETPGSHEWGFWDSKIEPVLAWLKSLLPKS